MLDARCTARRAEGNPKLAERLTEFYRERHD
jgi:hypothetical protein